VLVVSSVPGSFLWLATGAGVTLDRDTKPRVVAEALWFPYPETAWGGLGETGFRGGAFVSAHRRGNAGLFFGFIYGRPRADGFGLAFGAAGILATGWAQEDHHLQPLLSPEASFRVSYRNFAFRIMGIITPRGDILENDFYGATLEWLWPVY